MENIRINMLFEKSDKSQTDNDLFLKRQAFIEKNGHIVLGWIRSMDMAVKDAQRKEQEKHGVVESV